jgi:hypothetical protein
MAFLAQYYHPQICVILNWKDKSSAGHHLEINSKLFEKTSHVVSLCPCFMFGTSPAQV